MNFAVGSLEKRRELPSRGSDHLAQPCKTRRAVSVDRPSHDRAPTPGKGTFFDEFVDFKEPEGTRLTERLVELYDKVRPRQRKRGRENLRLRLRRIAANALRCHFFRSPPAVLYYRGAEIAAYDDKPSWMKHAALKDVVDALADADLVSTIIGKKMPRGHKTRSWLSSFWATSRLILLADECGVAEESFERRVPEDSLVRLYEPKSGHEFDRLNGGLFQPRKKKRIWFEPTAETNEWTTTLRAINDFYREQQFSVGLSHTQQTQWLADHNNDPDRLGVPLRKPEYFGTDLYRVFNLGDKGAPSFEFGGRLFGPWWQNISGDLRKGIVINGLSTVELDYRYCFARMLYHLNGLDVEGELYAVPEIDVYEIENGLEAGTYRPFIKWLFQVMLNGKGRPGLALPPDDVARPTDIAIGKVARWLKARHRPVADAFGTGAGFTLMRLESDIALEIVSTAMNEGWPVLPIHDSFVATVDRRERLRHLMMDIYYKKIGNYPAIKG